MRNTQYRGFVAVERRWNKKKLEWFCKDIMSTLIVGGGDWLWVNFTGIFFIFHGPSPNFDRKLKKFHKFGKLGVLFPWMYVCYRLLLYQPVTCQSCGNFGKLFWNLRMSQYLRSPSVTFDPEQTRFMVNILDLVVNLWFSTSGIPKYTLFMLLRSLVYVLFPSG